MRLPSRQTTARLTAGAAACAATAPGEIAEDKTFGAVGNAGQKQRAAGA